MKATTTKTTSSAGKGSKARNNFSDEFRVNFDDIDWGDEENNEPYKEEVVSFLTKRMITGKLKKVQSDSVTSTIIDEK